MNVTNWSLADCRKNFFIYVEGTDATDLLHDLKGSSIVAHVDVNRVACALYQNLLANAYATSAPYYTALLGTANGRHMASRELLERARDNRDVGAWRAALALMDDSAAFIEQSFEPLRQIQDNNLMPEAFQALLRQASAMLWGSFEAYCYDLYRLLFTKQVMLLRKVAAAYVPAKSGVPGTPWGDKLQKLAYHIDAEALRVPPVAAEDAFDWYSENKNLLSMNLRAIRFFARVIFAADAGLLALLNASEVTRLAARRNLILHAAGVVDQNYITNSGESLPLGTSLVVTPPDLELGFRAVSAAGRALANAASSVL